ncbi:hypothetical protein BDA99DRAFT_521709 [Phascolomyces articulosus]|uniref:Ubiquitin-like protease family profile domain-containing protein n=1 Tax=Phascolomyces articulosus TaxID=60185 RepID=A0AAD5JRN3_9FUNG|nr:hypothetical protein BDA99DRAFT_521709 [Phascolomyces articulosus]
MSMQNTEDLSISLRRTTTNPPHNLTRQTDRSRQHSEVATPIVVTSPHERILYKHNTLTSYRASNLRVGSRNIDRYHSNSRLPPNKPNAAMVSSKPTYQSNKDEVVLIDDDYEKTPKRSIISKMRSKEASETNAITKKQRHSQLDHTAKHIRFDQKSTPRTTEVTKRPSISKSKPSRIICPDDDEGIDPPSIKRMTTRSQKRNEKKTQYSNTEKICLIDEDDNTDSLNKSYIQSDDSDKANHNDVFDIDSLHDTSPPHKRRRSNNTIDDSKSTTPLYVSSFGQSSISKGESSSSSNNHNRMKWEKDDIDDSSGDDMWENALDHIKDKKDIKDIKKNKRRQSEEHGSDSDSDIQPCTTTESSIPNLIIPKRRKGIMFHSDPDDIPLKQPSSSITYSTNNHPNTRTSTRGLRSSDIYTPASSRLTRSATRGIQNFSNNIRGYFGKPQYITIDDDDSDVEMQQDLPVHAKSTNGQEVLFHYPSSAPGGVAVVREDTNRLMDGQMLNDSIIDFYVKWLLTNAKDFPLDEHPMVDGHEDHPSEEQSINTQPINERVHVFNTFFFARLKQSTKGDPYENVKKWTSKINLFEKDFVFIPIHEASHWYLLVVCHPKKCIPNDAQCIDLSKEEEDDKAIIYSLDSMGIKRLRSANRVIKYLSSAAEDRLGIDPQRFKKPVYVQANVPLQPNAYDCGIYVLHFIEKFLQQPEELIAVLTEKELDDNVWELAKIAEKREYISDLITALCEKHQQEEQHNDTTSQNGSDNNSDINNDKDEDCDVGGIEAEANKST